MASIDDLSNSELRQRLEHRNQAERDIEHILRHRDEPSTREALARFLGLDE